MPEALVTRRDDGPIAVLTLNRPENYNAYGHDMGAELMRYLHELTTDANIRACILTGAGQKSFCSGANLKDEDTHALGSLDEYLQTKIVNEGRRIFDELLAFRKPLICAVTGYAIGIGFQMALCCDILIAAPNAKFKLPQVSLGIMPAYGGGPRLAQWIGRGRAMEIVLTGRFVEAAEAERLGLVARVVAIEELMPCASELAHGLAKSPPTALALAKESIVRAMEDGPLAAASQTDLYRLTALTLTDDAHDRHDAWRRNRADPSPRSEPK